ncbi:MAG: SCO family protein [Gammaproteobacteria bacterium]|nr:SCO family protein [Gammaproteobacteria bacterium]
MNPRLPRILLLATVAFVAALIGARALLPDVTALPQLERAVWLPDLPTTQHPAVLLVTVDPSRDDAATLAPYVRYLDPAFHAVTGDEASLARLARALGAAYTRASMAAGSSRPLARRTTRTSLRATIARSWRAASGWGVNRRSAALR